MRFNVGFVATAEGSVLVESGNTRVLCNATVESGVPGYEAYVWMGLLAPRGTPTAIVDKIYRDLSEVLATAEVRSFMTNAGIEIVGSRPAEFARFFRAERDQWAKVVRETGAKAD